MCGGVVGDIGESIDKAVTQPIGKGLSEVDTFVNREIPGGWTLPAVIAAAYATGYLDPSVFGAEGVAAGTAEGATAAGNAAYADALAAGYTTEEATVMANAAAESYASYGGSSAMTGEQLTSAYASQPAPIFDYSTEATLTPGGNVVPATTLPTEMAAIDAEIAKAGAEAAKNLPPKISPFQAIQGVRAATGLLGGGQQQQQAYPQMQMGGRTQMPQGAVDYSGIYNLLALQRPKNPNSLLG